MPGAPSVDAKQGKKLLLTLTALGVVYGDIGTSPLYAFKECFYGPHAIAVNPVNVMGVLSLIFWCLVVVITVKYVIVLTRADNGGEGGTFALLGILSGAIKEHQGKWLFMALPFLSLVSAALLYSDGMITPAISVLSAVEGIEAVIPAASRFVVPATCLILVGLFSVQKYGTARIGGCFGPIMLVWFITLAVIGCLNIVKHPGVLTALSPYYALAYFQANGLHGFVVLGAVVLCITGGEALYADMGHFGRLPIRNGWLWIACPSLALNYMGQGALLLYNPAAAQSPFYMAVPSFLLVPMIILATMATVIASQAMITGVYSLTQQAMQFGFLPRMKVVHTSPSTRGQVYLPVINNLLMVACVLLVLIFQNSTGLAAAYGLAVTGAMGITSILYFAILCFVWNWPKYKSIPLLGLFLLFDLPFLVANLIKIPDGGWLPLAVGAAFIATMTTWKKGRSYLGDRFARMNMPFSAFIKTLQHGKISRSPGTGVYMNMNLNIAPMSLTRSLALIHTLPETIVLLSIRISNTPYVPADKRLGIDSRHKDLGVYRVGAYYGYLEYPNIPEISELSRNTELPLPLYDCTFYLGRETIVPVAENAVMARWRRELFVFLSRNARNASIFFQIPTSRVVEIGTHLEI